MDAITTTTQTAAKQYIVVKLGDEQYGINILYVDNIVRMQKITRVPKAQHHFVGVINLRGEIIPVMSIRRKFGLPEDVFTDKTRIIIIKIDQATVGVIVDQVKEVVSLEEDEIEKISVESGEEVTNFINAVGKSKGELISLLDIQVAIGEKDVVSAE